MAAAVVLLRDSCLLEWVNCMVAADLLALRCLCPCCGRKERRVPTVVAVGCRKQWWGGGGKQQATEQNQANLLLQLDGSQHLTCLKLFESSLCCLCTLWARCTPELLLKGRAGAVANWKCLERSNCLLSCAKEEIALTN